jgi:POT family proton-dependent oligopeptide transporter
MFGTEVWERFSYYGFMGLFVLFMVAPGSEGGLGYSTPVALMTFGIVTSLIWIAPIVGGWIADSFIGARRAVLLGCAGLALGNFVLAGSSIAASRGLAQPSFMLFAAGVLTMIIGAGLFKSNASALLGQLFSPDDRRREAGFVLFYMGINLGALAAPFGAGTLGESAGWHWGFITAGLGMSIGLCLFGWRSRRYFPESTHTRHDGPKIRPRALLQDVNVQLILIMAAFTVVYMTGQMTYGGVMNLYVAAHVDRMASGFLIPTTWFLALNPLLVVLLGPAFATFWEKRGLRTTRVVFVEKIAVGLLLMGMSFLFMMLVEILQTGQKPPWVLVVFYLLITTAELCVLPGGLVEISRRAPKNAVGLLMGCWIFTMGVGSFLAGGLGALFSAYPLSWLFALLGGAGAVFALVLVLIEPRLRARLAGRS